MSIVPPVAWGTERNPTEWPATSQSAELRSHRAATVMRHNVGMRAVIQRVDGASVSVDGEVVGEFTGFGLMVLIGVSVDDTPDKCAVLADKIWKMRIFEAPRLQERGIEIASESNEVAAADANLPILAISQFTLFADTSKGRRPTWNGAARGDMAEPMVEKVVAELRSLGATVATGRFGAYMSISQICDGPTTILIEV